MNWASLMFGSKFTIFALFYFVFEGNIPSTSPQGPYIWRGDLTEVFFALPVWGAFIWRGLYMEGLIFGILRYLSIMDSSTGHVLFAIWKESQNSLGFWIPRSGFRILCQYNLDSGFLNLYSGFQSPRLRIPLAKISRIPESGFPYMRLIFILGQQ